MTIDPSAKGFMIPQPVTQPPKDKQCPPGEHDMPKEWDYTHDPGGKKTCRKCGVTWFD